MYAPPRKNRTSRLGSVLMAVGVLALAGGTLVATASFLGPALAPAGTTAPGHASASPVTIGSAGSSGSPQASVSPSPVQSTTGGPVPVPSASPSAVPSPSASPPSGPFSMDLYRKGAFIGELTDTWCLPAAMQTSANIMDLRKGRAADRTRDRQQELFTLARKLAPAPDKAAEPEGWAMGLTKLGYGKYEVQVRGSLKAAIQTAATAIRLTGRPAGLLVWRGAHSWVMSGFKATADPATTNDFTVTAVYIEDVWYPRLSRIWGYSNPPDTLVPVKDLPIDFKPWKRPQARYPDKDGKFVVVIPVR